MRRYLGAALLAAAAGVAAGQGLPPEVLLLARAKAQIRATLDRLPDFTCLLTTQRFKGADSKRPEDTLKLEVLYAGGREYYTSPGGSFFNDSSPSSFTSSGMMGNGTFALHLKAVFLDGYTVITYAGEEELAGTRVRRYDFSLAQQWSGYSVTVDGNQAVVGLRGTAWIDAQTANVLRLDTYGDQISPILRVKEIRTSVQYAPTNLSGQVIMAPQHGEMSMTRTKGDVSRNIFDFTQCRAYEAESAIRFDTDSSAELQPAPAEPKMTQRAGPLPAGLEIKLRLLEPVTSRSAVGGMVKAEVESDISRAGKALIRKGAQVRGRILQLESVGYADATYTVGAIEFTEIETIGGVAAFRGELIAADPIRSLEWQIASAYSSVDTARYSEMDTQRNDWTRLLISQMPRAPGVSGFAIREGQFRLPVKYHMILRTIAP
jgi:hypothetical protein